MADRCRRAVGDGGGRTAVNGRNWHEWSGVTHESDRPSTKHTERGRVLENEHTIADSWLVACDHTSVRSVNQPLKKRRITRRDLPRTDAMRSDERYSAPINQAGIKFYQHCTLTVIGAGLREW
jgi:hypothetical protein